MAEPFEMALGFYMDSIIEGLGGLKLNELFARFHRAITDFAEDI